jgi:hypothetical protein
MVGVRLPIASCAAIEASGRASPVDGPSTEAETLEGAPRSTCSKQVAVITRYPVVSTLAMHPAARIMEPADCVVNVDVMICHADTRAALLRSSGTKLRCQSAMNQLVWPRRPASHTQKTGASPRWILRRARITIWRANARRGETPRLRRASAASLAWGARTRLKLNSISSSVRSTVTHGPPDIRS